MDRDSLINEALLAFAVDPGYLVAITKAAHTIKNRHDARLDRSENSVIDSGHDNTN